MVRHVWDRISAAASSARGRVTAAASVVADAARDVWSRLDGWDRLVLLATGQLLAGMILVFGLGVALLVHGALWLVVGGLGARGAEIGQLLQQQRQKAGIG